MEEKRKLDKDEKGMCMVVGGLLGMFLAAIFISFNIFVFGAICAISLLVVIMGFILLVEERVETKEAFNENADIFLKEYDEYADKLGVVRGDVEVTLFEAEEYEFMPHYFWVDNGTIHLFPMTKYYMKWKISSSSRPDISELKIISIPIDSILYFEEAGELRKYTTVSGGGTSLKGALVGYALGDDVGAIIGSREPIKTNIVSEDDRRIELIYKSPEGQIENLEFKHDAYDVFKKEMPQKELKRIVNLSTVQGIKDKGVKSKPKALTAKEKIKQLTELKTEGLITEEEFSEQKKKILESI